MRIITVTSSLNDQLGYRVVARVRGNTEQRVSGQIFEDDVNGFSSTSIFAS